MTTTQPPNHPTTQPPNHLTTQPPTLYCANHPDRETLIRCGRCDKPICVKCQVRHPVGIRCKDCARLRKDPLTTLTPLQYVLAFASALGASIIGGFIGSQIGFFALFIGPIIGGGIAEFVGRVIGYKRGLPLQIIVSVCIVLGLIISNFIIVVATNRGVETLLQRGDVLRGLVVGSIVTSIIYIVFAIGGAITRLR